MKQLSLLLILLSLSSAAYSYDAVLSLKGADGKVIQGAVEPGTKPASVNLKRKDGKVFRNVPLASFSAESRKSIAASFAVAKEKAANLDIHKASRLDISFQRQKSEGNNKYNDIDDRVIVIQPKVSIDSNERKNTYKNVNGEVIVVGIEAVTKDRWVILNRQKFTFAKIEPDQEVDWEGKQFECRYDPDFAGFDYEGYLIVLRNKKGEVVLSKASSSRWAETEKELLKARTGIGYNKDFSQTLSLRTTFGLPGSRR